MGDVVDLKPISLIENIEFVADMARFRESLLSEKAIRKKYRMFDDTVWEKLADDDNLVRAIEAESTRRIRDGSVKREKAQALIVKGPDILNGIMSDPNANARHRIDSCKILNDFCNGPGDTAPASDRFIISIVLNSDGAGGEPQVLHFDKSRAIDPHDGDDTDTAPQELLAVVATKKKDDGGGNNTL